MVPLWVAPNTITLTGWLILLSSTLILMCQDLTFQKELPSWCFYYAAASVWIYSTLDAIDGKQARRTQSSSPLGQLFDHGCDAFCVSFLVINFSTSAHLSPSHSLLLFTTSYSAFWIANWKEYNTGVLVTGFKYFGVTEMHVLAMICFFATGLFGQNMWLLTLKDTLPN